MNRLWDVDVTGVHLVDSPANHRRFAVVKAQGGAAAVTCPNGDCDYAGPMTESNDCPDCGKSLTSKSQGAPVKTIKLADIQKALEGKTADVDQAAFLKSLGIELPAEPVPAPPPTKLDKSKLAPDVIAYLEAQEQMLTKAMASVTELATAAATAAKTDLQKRVQLLKGRGFEIDPETATPVQVAAFEQAWEQIGKNLEKVGILKGLGDPTRAEPEALPLRAAVQKAVREHLGREPIDKYEEAKVKQSIYKSRPGLLTAVVLEERAQRAA